MGKKLIFRRYNWHKDFKDNEEDEGIDWTKEGGLYVISPYQVRSKPWESKTLGSLGKQYAKAYRNDKRHFYDFSFKAGLASNLFRRINTYNTYFPGGVNIVAEMGIQRPKPKPLGPRTREERALARNISDAEKDRLRNMEFSAFLRKPEQDLFNMFKEAGFHRYVKDANYATKEENREDLASEWWDGNYERLQNIVLEFIKQNKEAKKKDYTVKVNVLYNVALDREWEDHPSLKMYLKSEPFGSR